MIEIRILTMDELIDEMKKSLELRDLQLRLNEQLKIDPEIMDMVIN